MTILAGYCCCAGFSQSRIPVRGDAKMKMNPVIGLKAYGFDLRDVRLLDGSPFKHAMDIDGQYLLWLKPARLLNRFYKNSHLEPTDSSYGGWEREGLSGHSLGHYLSACSMMYASTGDERFKAKVDFIVGELAKCVAARGTGYVGAIPNEDSIFYPLQRGEIKSGGFDLNGGWSPWYTVHKVMAGLVDAYLYCDNMEALRIARGMADWTGAIVAPLNESQRKKMLKCEFGGMNDVLANIYAITGEKKYLDLSYKFYDDFVMGRLAQGEPDPIAGKHSNTNIPKAIGSARQYELTAALGDSMIASRFWDLMVHGHSYVTGGNGNYEYLGQAGKLNDALSDNTAETCCAYNMLKLTGHLFTWQPDSRLADYYERTLYNDILASQNPSSAMMLYFEPLRTGGKKEFSDSADSFTCCVGTGMEDHAKYTEDIYFQGADGSLYVNLFIPSILNWADKKIRVSQQTAFPEKGLTTLSIYTAAPVSFPLHIRWPWWATKGVTVKVNGQSVTAEKDGEGYITISRKWKNGDKIEAVFSMGLYTESMPDNPNRVAMLYGPLVLAGNLGDTVPDPVYGSPVLLTGHRDPANWAIADAKAPLVFHMHGVGKPFDVDLSPFYRNVNNYYGVYWDYFTPGEWVARQAAYEAEKKRQKEIEAATIDIMRLGEMQPERDHHLASSEQSYVSDAMGRKGREARKDGFFSFVMKVQPGGSNSLLCTYIGDDRDRSFDILVDSVKVGSEYLKGGATGKFFDVEYPIPAGLLQNKTEVTVRIQGTNGKTAGRMFTCRTMRKY